MRRFGVFLGGLVAAAIVLVAVSCRDATQITIDITTDVPCVGVANDAGVSAPPEPGLFSKNGRVALWLSDPSTPQTVARTCTQDGARARVGTIAIVPSGSADERVSVTVAIDAQDPTQSEQCNGAAPSASCIVAHRTVGFIPHTSLTLPIHLSLACAGVQCGKGFTCDNGKCASDGVTCDDKACTSVDSGIVDALPIADANPNVDAIAPGKCDGGTLGNAQNCMQCGFACAGTCQPWGCQLVTTNPLGSLANEGCIAVQSGVVVWSAAKGGSGSVFWVPRAGTAWGTVEASVGVGPVVASTGFFSYVVRSPPNTGPSFVRDLFAGQPPSSASNIMKSQPGPTGDHPWVARGSSARCASTFNGNLHGIDCELGYFEGYPTSFRHLAVGKASYLALNGTSLVFGPAGAGIGALQPNTTLVKPTSVVAYGSVDDFVVAAQDGTQYGLYRVTIDTVGSKLTVGPKPFYSQTSAFLGLHTFGTSVYFADDSKRIAKVDYNGVNTQTAQVLVPNVLAGFTAMRGQVCLDVDDVAVYYLVDGLPMRAPK